MMPSLSRPRTLTQIAIVSLLLVSLLLGAIWAWPQVPTWRSPIKVPNAGALRQIREEGLPLPTDRTAKKAQVRIGGNRWVGQDLTADNGAIATILMRPQSGAKDLPYVDWSDLDGFFKWQQEDIQTLTVDIANTEPATQVKARWFIARDPRNTRVVHFPQRVAVAQWYALGAAGRPTILQWFWRDQWAQLQGGRMPWIAVSVRLPVEPGVELATTEATTTELITTIQGAIVTALELQTD